MTSPQPHEDLIEKLAVEFLLGVREREGENAVLDVLEAVSSIFGGWDLLEYRRAFADKRVVPVKRAKLLAVELTQIISNLPIHFGLVLCRLAQPQIPHGEKRETGAYYTDFRLARDLAKSFVACWPQNGKLVDPACGTGVLLVSAVLEISGGDPRSIKDLLRHSIFGCDLSENALRGARIALGSLTDSIDTLCELDSHLLHQDSLIADSQIWRHYAPSGFSAVIGNPPWEKLKVNVHEFNNLYGDGGHYGANVHLTSSEKTRLEQDRARIANSAQVLVELYPLSAEGEFDLYKAFIELSYRIVADDGQIGLIVPAGLIRSSSTKKLRKVIFSRSPKLTISIVDNRSHFFAIDTRFKFLIVHASLGERRRTPICLQHARGTESDIETTGRAKLSRSDLRLLGEDLLVPEVRSETEWKLFKRLMTVGVPLRDLESEWRPTLLREVDMTRDKGILNRRRKIHDLPLIEGRMVHQHRLGAKSYAEGTGRKSIWLVNEPGSSEVKPQFWVSSNALPKSVAQRAQQFRIGFCDITGQTNERTVLAARIPPNVVCGNKVPTGIFDEDGGSVVQWAWLAIANSFVFDWLARRIVTTTLNYFLLLSLPFPNISKFSIESKYLADQAEKLAQMDLDPCCSPSTYELIRADLDARIARLYGLGFEEFKTIMEDFTLLDRGQPPLQYESHSTFTRDLVLSTYESLFGAEQNEYEPRVSAAREIGAMAYVPAQFGAKVKRHKPKS
jgi:Alw26I/Eco31I/Esp3I family type II restriction m6 adenine DNA methyltransferase